MQLRIARHTEHLDELVAFHPESLLVLYLGDAETVSEVAARLGAQPVEPANPYWAEHGLTFEDPDGFRVVLVPEAFCSA